ncbi:hypothetical protein J6590_002075 [Homalodisca vitripennis]|nr:hypothetical protein J6590_002075 [Homalodisca vitripennis]
MALKMECRSNDHHVGEHTGQTVPSVFSHSQTDVHITPLISCDKRTYVGTCRRGESSPEAWWPLKCPSLEFIADAYRPCVRLKLDSQR